VQPPGPRRLRRRQLRQLGIVSAPSPPVEELAVLGNPRPGVHRARNIVITAEPAGRITRQARRADHRDPGGHMLAQVRAEHRFIKGLARLLGPGVSVGIDQARQQPAPGHQVRARHRVAGPPVSVSEQVDTITARQRTTANPEDRHGPRLPRRLAQH